jgi:hypothetical protein
VSELKTLIADRPDLLDVIDRRLEPSKPDQELNNWRKKADERKKKRELQRKRNRDSWVQFWREVAEHPENAFSKDRSWSTAWNLWMYEFRW